jgi:hypothetical protein
MRKTGRHNRDVAFDISSIKDPREEKAGSEARSGVWFSLGTDPFADVMPAILRRQGTSAVHDRPADRYWRNAGGAAGRLACNSDAAPGVRTHPGADHPELQVRLRGGSPRLVLRLSDTLQFLMSCRGNRQALLRFEGRRLTSGQTRVACLFLRWLSAVFFWALSWKAPSFPGSFEVA